MKKVIELVGYSSGDGEAHCMDVSLEEYRRLMGESPRRYDKGYTKDTFRYYLEEELESGKKYKIKIEIEEITSREDVKGKILGFAIKTENNID